MNMYSQIGYYPFIISIYRKVKSKINKKKYIN